MNGQSLDITKELLEQLKKLVPQAFSEDKLDVSQLKTLLGEDIFVQNERYGLSWAGKNEAYQVMQQPTLATLEPQPEASIDWENAEHLFIEGENLEVLKLLQKSYFGQVKMIYIDPPYNTGNDSFIYPDKFSETKEEYLARIEEKSDDGYLMKEGYFRKNSKENGQYHSNWLSMMLPRLYLARNLLTDDGVIFVSIDDNEQANLKLLMDEVFGEENFTTVLVWEKKKKGSYLSEDTTNIKEYILVYTKNFNDFNGLIGEIARTEETYPTIKTTNNRGIRTIKKGIFSKYKEVNHIVPAGTRISSGNMEMILHNDLIIKDRKLQEDVEIESNWIYSQEKLNEYSATGNLYITQDLYFRRKVAEPRYKKIKDLLLVNRDSTDDISFHYSDNLYISGWGTNEDGFDELHSLLGNQNIMSFPKPSKLIAKLALSACWFDKNALILDFFSGSGTTAQAVMELNEEDNGNRQYICVQLPEKTEETSEAYKAGYKTIAEITQARIQKVIEKIKQQRQEQGTLLDEAKPKLGYRKYKLTGSNFKQWRGDIPQTEQDIETLLDKIEQVEYSNAKPQAMLWELLLKNGYSLTEQVKVIQAGNTPIYLTANQQLAIVLEAYNEQVQAQLLTLKPKQVITLDSLFKGQDMAKANYQLKLKDNDIEFKTI